MIDLTQIYSGITDKIKLDGKYEIPKDLITDNRILDIRGVKLLGSIDKNEEDYFINAKINTEIKIKDSISLEPVWYRIDTTIEEKLEEFIEKSENSLDIINFLWQNIVMEVPLRYTDVNDYNEYKGDGWKLVSEEDFTNNNPFNKLLESEDWSD